ncbi:diguanylate cyclase (GGDEF) domain-containing protein [Pelagibacterium luteolum]|uniref:diguanylate cyclase n=2 Tax=Pelagibacterium luteolum TaxID=440168 RepID=A0A1G7WAP8_9HYPH|nr:diguanylate cyclase (GGDEF) domain-containing protein [Pelagibacterium luteolum]
MGSEAEIALTGHYFFSYLNPMIALVLAAAFALVWRTGRERVYLLLLTIAFAASGVAFLAQDLLVPPDWRPGRILINGVFFASVMTMCSAGLLRVGQRVPKRLFAVLSLVTAVGFVWYLYVDPSLTFRIYVMNTAFAAIAIITLSRLLAAHPRSASDWLVVALAGVVLAAAIIRFSGTVFEGIDVNPDGDLRDSDYWATIQAFTPIMYVSVALVFLLATSLELMAQLRGEAQRDHLTGLFNRRGFETAALGAMANADAKRIPTAILLADIDDFKKINDTYGHGVGDMAIAAIAAAIARAAPGQIIARIGGEEFAIYRENARRAEMSDLAQHLLDGVRSISVPGLPDTYPLTVSLGIHLRQPGESLTQMLSSADQALYLAKHHGKDRMAMSPLRLRAVLERPDILSA